MLSSFEDKVKEKAKNKNKQILLSGIFIAFAINFLFFLYGSIEMYLLNKRDMLFGEDQVLMVLIPLALIMFVISSIIVFVLWMISEKLCFIFDILYFISFVATYIQGTFLVKELPIMDGTPHEWSELAAGRYKTILAWFIITVIVIVIVRFKKDLFIPVTKYVSVIITLMLLSTMIVLSLSSHSSDEIISTTDYEYLYSSDKNFIILLLDSVSSEVANEVLKEYPEYCELFNDFTYYRNNLGSYVTTSYALSYTFSGKWYKNDENYDDYRLRAYKESPLFANLHNLGYKLGLYSIELPADKSMVDMFENVVDLERTVTSFPGAAKCLIQMSGYRYGMFDLKRFFNVNIFEAYNYFTPKDHIPYNSDNEWFYVTLAQNDITLTADKQFKFIHIEGAHVPWNFDENLQRIGNTTYKQNVLASFNAAKQYIDKLKAADVYDNSVIIVMADHGIDSGLETDGKHRHQMPFMAIKGINEKHDLVINDAPISCEDYLEAFKRLADGAQSLDVFDAKEGDERTRTFIYYNGGDQHHMEEYIQTGHVFETDKFIPTGVVYDRQ